MTGTAASVRRTGPDRLRIVGLPSRSHLADELTDWLEHRPEVVRVGRRPSGSIDVMHRAQDRARGTLERSLEDYLYAHGRPRPRLDVRLAHHVPGRARLQIRGIGEDDVLRLAAWLRSRPGVLRASGLPATGSILVDFDPQKTMPDQLAADARASNPAEWPPAPPPPPRTPWGALVTSTAALAGGLGQLAPAPVLSALVTLSAIPVARRALDAFQQKRASVDQLDAAAIAVSVGTGSLTTAAFITWLLSVGDALLERAADKARAELSRLVSLEVPEACRIETKRGAERCVKVPASSLNPGDRIVVGAGQRIAADGRVVAGVGGVDEKALTGESELRVCEPGDRVFAATLVAEGELVIEVERVGASTTAAKIVQALHGAGAKPMTLQKDTERIADKLVIPTFGLATGALALTGEVERFSGVLITDFGTGVRIAVPTAALAAIASAAREGVLVKGAQYLERLARADVVVFDKTGTLTEGRPEIRAVELLDGLPATEVLALAAAAEAQSSHPVAEAMRRRAASDGLVVPIAERESLVTVAGRGVDAQVGERRVRVGNLPWMREGRIALGEAERLVREHQARGLSSLFVAIDGRLAALISYADRPRTESAGVVKQLRAGRKRKVLLFSGDADPTAQAVARALGLDGAKGGMLPQDKAAEIKKLQESGRIVAMVGDGINDAPALAHADVGISLHGGADVALETADVVLLKGGLERLPEAFDIAAGALASVHRGLGIVVIPNAVAIVLAAMGLLPSTVAALVNNGSTLVAAAAGLTPLLRRRKR